MAKTCKEAWSKKGQKAVSKKASKETINARACYLDLLNAIGTAKGKKRKELVKTASYIRKRMIAANTWHEEDDLPKPKYNIEEIKRKMPPCFKKRIDEAAKFSDGKKCLRRFPKFHGVPFPTDISEIYIPGKTPKVLMGMGHTPVAVIADGPKNNYAKIKRIRKKFKVVCDPDGRRLMLLSGKNSRAQKAKLTFLGWAPETHYIPPKGVELAGSFKRGKYWIHKHDDEGGSWPKVYQDQAGNIIYARSTYRISKWIRR